jgi:aspartyl-tRNA(Asn)/glutamyl-tRNA(Gln) amidotransferase subunit A
MEFDAWVAAIRADAAARQVPGLPALVDTLASATRALREAPIEAADDAPAHPDGGPRAALGPLDAGASSRPAGVLDGASTPRPPRPGPPPGAGDLRSIEALAAGLREGRLTASSLAASCLDTIARLDPALNAFISVTGDRARAEAEAADRDIAAGAWRGPLHGIPVSLKDLVSLAGVPTTAASRVRSAEPARADAPVVRRLVEAGAVIVGTCNLHEFAFGTTSEDSAFGPVRQPWFPDRSPGGSSGGSAVSVATGMAAASIGTDTGGSIRIPAAACGLVGLKPGFGEVPTAGVVPLAWTLDHVGPICRTVEDAAVVYRVLAGRSPAPNAVSAPPASIRLGLLGPYFLDRLDPAVRSGFAGCVAVLAGAGIDVQLRTVPEAPLTAPVYLHTVLAEAAALHARALETRPEAYTAAVRVRLEMARYVEGEDYARAQQLRARLARQVDEALAGCDALVLPTLPILPPRLGASTAEMDGPEPVRNATLRLTQLFDLTGHPALTLPGAWTAEGLPVGLQLVGARGGTEALLRCAAVCETVLGSAGAERPDRGGRIGG